MGRKRLKTGFASCLALLLAVPAFANDGCPPPAPELKEIECDQATADSGRNPQERKKCDCNKAIKDQQDPLRQAGNNQRLCQQINNTCPKNTRWTAEQQQNALTNSQFNFQNVAQCAALRESRAKAAGDTYADCKKTLSKACSGVQEAGKEIKKCEDAEKKARKAEKDNNDQKKQGEDNAKKSGDDAKKEQSAGGMPQMPQIPQQQGGDESPQQQADYPQATSPTPGSGESKPPEIETAKLDEDKDKTAVPTVGFGNTTPTDSATVTAPGNSFTSQGIDPNLRGLASNNFGDKPEGGTVAASASPPGGSGSGGLNSSGASLPGGGQQGADSAKGPNEANPYEIPVGSGGRLGAPKGKTGGESDTALDAAASSAFKDDFKGGDLAGNGAGADVAAGPEEDPGYSIFKMVKYRYAELKKKGNI